MSTVTSPWEMETKKGGGAGDGKPFEVCPAGNYPATLVGIFDVGNQPSLDDNKQPIERRQVVLVFELMKKDSNGKPFLMANRYTWSMHEKATFYSIACNLTGKKFGDGERFDPRSLLGAPCMVQVTNTAPNDKGKVFANVKAVTSYPEGFPAIAPGREPLAWSVMDGTPPPDGSWVPYVYGKSLSDLIQMSAEYREGKVPGGAGGRDRAAVLSEGEDDGDEPPF